MSRFILYTTTPSRAGIVRWMLEECGADYQAVDVGSNQSALLAVNPLGKVPTLKDGGHVLTETAAIVSYLAEQFPEKNLIPAPQSPERGDYYHWLCYAVNLEYAAVDKMRGLTTDGVFPGTVRKIKKAIGYGDFDSYLNLLRTHLQNRRYIVGDGFTALDLYFTGLLGWLIQAVQAVAPEPVFMEYLQTHYTRPASVRAQEAEAEEAVKG
ncbi:glutathione S-transferase family protein [Neisseria chenwenguii]|uniref:Glutathione S-transferase n=1 Tax=Neisseria chenwenguii TaxID=1853278 RepID=A0A220S316_9NEIS|nr:glutathione S-transferase family protein [Neisseria chenwenguii]ASK27889.1 glutathione S-transferase [Neisseria chenwenguii]ROV56256.1 glutathione S-transferase family protein [Neisseria chenwenguii]